MRRTSDQTVLASARHLAKRFRRARSGAVAVEFTLIAPVLMAIFFGGFALSQAVAVSRKVSITTRALADLTTQSTQVSSSDLTTIANAATQIMAPFDVTQLSTRVTQIQTDSQGAATVSWSKAGGAGALAAYATGQSVTVPAAMRVANMYYIFSETKYTYVPIVSIGAVTMNFGDNIYMLPRKSASVNFTG